MIAAHGGTPVFLPPASDTLEALGAMIDGAAGADVLVAGTATFRGGPDRYASNIAALKGRG